MFVKLKKSGSSYKLRYCVLQDAVKSATVGISRVRFESESGGCHVTLNGESEDIIVYLKKYWTSKVIFSPH